MFKANYLITCFYPLDPDLKQKVLNKGKRGGKKGRGGGKKGGGFTLSK